MKTVRFIAIVAIIPFIACIYFYATKFCMVEALFTLNRLRTNNISEVTAFEKEQQAVHLKVYH